MAKQASENPANATDLLGLLATLWLAAKNAITTVLGGAGTIPRSSCATGSTFAEISKQNFRLIRVALPPKLLSGELSVTAASATMKASV